MGGWVGGGGTGCWSCIGGEDLQAAPRPSSSAHDDRLVWSPRTPRLPVLCLQLIPLHEMSPKQMGELSEVESGTGVLLPRSVAPAPWHPSHTSGGACFTQIFPKKVEVGGLLTTINVGTVTQGLGAPGHRVLPISGAQHFPVWGWGTKAVGHHGSPGEALALRRTGGDTAVAP